MRTNVDPRGRVRLSLVLALVLFAVLIPLQPAGATADSAGTVDSRDFQNWYWYGTVSSSFEDTVDYFDDSGSIDENRRETGAGDLARPLSSGSS